MFTLPAAGCKTPPYETTLFIGGDVPRRDKGHGRLIQGGRIHRGEARTSPEKGLIVAANLLI